MAAVKTHAFAVWEDTGLIVMARIVGNAGTAITQASLTSIKMDVYDITDEDAPAAIGSQDTLTINSVVFDTLQDSDVRWTRDDEGYNFLHTVAATRFASAGPVRIEFMFDPASGENFMMVWEGTVRARYAG